MTNRLFGQRWLPLLVLVGICCAPASDALRMSNPPPRVTGKKIVLHNVSVDTEEAAITQDSTPVLDEAVQILQRAPRATVVVADNPARPIDANTAALRAHMVRSYLIAHGVAGARLQTETAAAAPSSGTDTAAAIVDQPTARD